jgi:hypothetical protein
MLCRNADEREDRAKKIISLKSVSGRSKPPLVLAAFSSAPYPGGYRTIHVPCSGLHPQGFVVPAYPVPQTLSELLARLPALLAVLRLDRIIAKNRPCRFCAIAVTLATRTCVRLRDRWVGGLSSATYFSYRQPLSPSHFSIFGGRADKRSDSDCKTGIWEIET